MGIMYKLLVKHRNLRLDLMSESETTNTECQSTTTTRNATSLGHVEDDIDNGKQFSAEHILQLCKFLAEKSKRNKELLQQQHVKGRTYRHKRHSCEMPNGSASETMSPTCHRQQQQQHANELPCWPTTTATTTTTASPNINTAVLGENAATATTPTCSIDLQSSKRDILLKIRSQILERKRQRKMACVLMQQRIGVWRPW